MSWLFKSFLVIAGLIYFVRRFARFHGLFPEIFIKTAIRFSASPANFMVVKQSNVTCFRWCIFVLLIVSYWVKVVHDRLIECSLFIWQRIQKLQPPFLRCGTDGIPSCGIVHQFLTRHVLWFFWWYSLYLLLYLLPFLDDSYLDKYFQQQNCIVLIGAGPFNCWFLYLQTASYVVSAFENWSCAPSFVSRSYLFSVLLVSVNLICSLPLHWDFMLIGTHGFCQWNIDIDLPKALFSNRCL